jgi:hypothetical protein
VSQRLTDIHESLDESSQLVGLDGFALELIHLDSLPPMSTSVPRPLNMFGFTHVSVRVDDVDAVA